MNRGIVMDQVSGAFRAFRNSEDGIALSEYLVLLGLLLGGLISAVGFVAAGLGIAWNSWGEFFSSIPAPF